MLLWHAWRLLMLAIVRLMLCLHDGTLLWTWTTMRVRIGGRLLCMILRVRFHDGKNRVVGGATS